MGKCSTARGVGEPARYVSGVARREEMRRATVLGTVSRIAQEVCHASGRKTSERVSSLAALTTLLTSCYLPPRENLYWVTPSLTQTQRMDVFLAVQRWNLRVGPGGRKGVVTLDEREATVFIETKPATWLQETRGPNTAGVFWPSSSTITIRSDAEGEFFLRLLEHEIGHSLGLTGHTAKGLMDRYGSEPWSEEDQRYCQAKGVCE